MKFTDSSKGGRKARFSRKLSTDLSIDSQIQHALLGDAHLSRGGSIVREIFLAGVGLQYAIPPDAESRWRTAVNSLLGVLYNRDAAVFRQIADYLQADLAMRSGKFAEPIMLHVANFIYRRRYGKNPSEPTVKEIHADACARLENPPDYKTVERIARHLGVKARARRK